MLRVLRSAACAMLAALMSLVTFLPAGPLLVLREREGRSAFFGWLAFLGIIALVTGNLALLVPIYGSALVVFYFYELEAAGFSLRRSAALSVLASSLLIFFAFVVWVRHLGFAPVEFLRGQMEAVAVQTKAFPPVFQMDVDKVFPHLPAILVSLMILVLWLGLLIEPGVTMMVYRQRPEARFSRLLERFRVPGWAIWPFILAMAGAFIDVTSASVGVSNALILGFQHVCMNLFIVAAFIYFLQGVAILSFLFSVTRTGPIWRALIYVLLIGNLAPFLAGVGVADFWLDFRTKLRRKTTETTV